MSKYWDAVKPTYIENWPPELTRLSFATNLVILTPKECDNLILLYQVQEWGDSDAREMIDGKVLTGLSERLDAAIWHFPHGAFVRLGSRSPKDCYDAHLAQFCAKSGQQAVEWLTSSERVGEDLELAQAMDYLPFVAVREWKHIPGHEEFRLFVSGHQIVGASQYDYLHGGPNLSAEAGSIRWAIDTFFRQQLRDALHVDPVIVDVWVHQRPIDHGSMWQVKLVEINPYFTMTDPCLFSWRDVDQWTQADPYELRLVDTNTVGKPIDYESLLQERGGRE